VYWEHLQQALPDSLLGTEFFQKYRAAFAPAIN
jgi:hypothetical protein